MVASMLMHLLAPPPPPGAPPAVSVPSPSSRWEGPFADRSKP